VALSREELKQLARPQVEDCTVEGLEIRIRKLSSAAMERMWARQQGEANQVRLIPYIAACCLANGDGELMYDPEKPEDLAEVAEMSGAFLNALVDKFNELHGFQADKDAIQEAEKN
jgi:ribonuclease PH